MSDTRNDKEKRTAYFKTTGELLADLFHFSGCVVHRIDTCLDRPDTFLIYIRGPGLPVVAEGAQPELISPTYSVCYVKAGEVAPEDMEKVTRVSP